MNYIEDIDLISKSRHFSREVSLRYLAHQDWEIRCHFVDQLVSLSRKGIAPAYGVSSQELLSIANDEENDLVASRIVYFLPMADEDFFNREISFIENISTSNLFSSYLNSAKYIATKDSYYIFENIYMFSRCGFIVRSNIFSIFCDIERFLGRRVLEIDSFLRFAEKKFPDFSGLR